MKPLVEWGIMWSEGTESGSVTPMPSREMAERYLWLATRMPGGLTGHVVRRFVTYSNWREAQV